MKSILLFSLSVLLLSSCVDEEVASCVDAYDVARDKVLQAENSEELLEISYALYIEMKGMTEEDREAKKITKARKKFETAVKNKEVEFYSIRHKRK